MVRKKRVKKQATRAYKKHAVDKHLGELKKNLMDHEKRNKKTNNTPKNHESIIHKQRLLWVLMVIIPAIVIVFLAILLVQSERMLSMKTEMLSMGVEIGDLREQNAFYKRAYELTLDDVRVLAEAFGGDERYELLSEELRRTEIETVLGVTDGTIYALGNEDLWRQYVAEDKINQSCLTLVEANTVAKTTMLSITTEGKGKFGVYVDGNFLQDITVEEPVTSRVSVELEEREHEVTFILKEGEVAFEGFLFDLIEVPLDSGVFDAGVASAGYDCEDISDAQLALEGTLRFFVDKK